VNEIHPSDDTSFEACYASLSDVELASLRASCQRAASDTVDDAAVHAWFLALVDASDVELERRNGANVRFEGLDEALYRSARAMSTQQVGALAVSYETLSMRSSPDHASTMLCLRCAAVLREAIANRLAVN